MRPLISVIIPVYNVRQYIKKCLDTAIASARRCYETTGKNVEIICVDDGATDGSGAFLDEYAANFVDDRVNLKIIHQKNGGVSVARNHGLEEASGEWVRFVDADDWVDNCLDERLANVIQSSKGVDFIAFVLTWMDEDGNIKKQMGHDNPPIIMDGDALLGSKQYSMYAGTVANKILRRRIIEDANLRFLPGVQPSEDDLFNMLFLTYNVKAQVCPEITGYCYRLTPGSAVRTMSVKKSMFLADLFHVLYKRWKEIRTPGLQCKLVEIAKALSCIGICDTLKYRKECIVALVSSQVFNSEAIPHLFLYGEMKSKCFALIYSLLPKGAKQSYLLKMFRHR